MRAVYRALKDHATARGIYFSLPFPYWRRIALRSDYLNRTGLNGHCLTVDRKDNLKGYVQGNVRFITRIENSEKQARRDAIRMTAGMRWQANHK